MTKQAIVEQTDAMPAQVPQVTSLLAEAIKNPELSVEKLDRLVDLQIKVMDRQAKIDFSAAMTRLNKRKEVIPTNRVGTGPAGAKYPYADFPQVVSHVTPWLEECGLSFTHRQEPVVESGQVVMVMVYCTVAHSGGHQEEFSYPAIPDNKLREKLSPSQLIQLAITYAKRQTLLMGLGLATEEDKQDDDAIVHSSPVSDEQAANLRALIEEADADEDKFLKWIKAESIEAIPAKAYEDCIKALEARRKRK